MWQRVLQMEDMTVDRTANSSSSPLSASGHSADALLSLPSAAWAALLQEPDSEVTASTTLTEPTVDSSANEKKSGDEPALSASAGFSISVALTALSSFTLQPLETDAIREEAMSQPRLAMEAALSAVVTAHPAEAELVPNGWLSDDALLSLAAADSALPLQLQIVAVPVNARDLVRPAEAPVASERSTASLAAVLDYFRPVPPAQLNVPSQADKQRLPPPPTAEVDEDAVRELLGAEQRNVTAVAGDGGEAAFIHANRPPMTVDVADPIDPPSVAAEGGIVRSSLHTLLRYFLPSTPPLAQRGELAHPLAQPQQLEEQVELGHSHMRGSSVSSLGV
jgi:hypothetical protein